MKHYIIVEKVAKDATCEGCIFHVNDSEWHASCSVGNQARTFPCISEMRDDERDVIFVLKEVVELPE